MLRFLIEKEFKQIFRNAFLPKLILIMPVMMMLVMPWAANQEVKDVKLCVVDHDRSETSARLVEKVMASTYFVAAPAAATYDEALSRVEEGRADVVLEIPRDFGRHLEAPHPSAPQVFIAANAVNGTRGTIAATYLAGIVQSAGATLMQKPVAPTAAASRTAAVEPVSAVYRFNPNLEYLVYMVPALMVMLLTLLAGFLPALNIVSEKEAGTIEQINVTPVGRGVFILAKLLPYWLIGLFVLTVCMGLGVAVYGLRPEGSWLTVYGVSALYVLVVSGMGLVISNYSSTMQQAMFVMFFFMMILLLMSGLLTPLTSMPDWAQWIAAVNPLKYYIVVMRAVYLKGSSAADVLPNFYALAAFAAVLGTWAMLSYRKQA